VPPLLEAAAEPRLVTIGLERAAEHAVEFDALAGRAPREAAAPADALNPGRDFAEAFGPG
jgi:hypothetical protein